MSISIKEKNKASKGLYIVMAISMVGISSVPVFFKILFSKSPCVATVNGLAISKEEFIYAMNREERVLSAYREKFGANYQKILKLFGRSDRADDTALQQLIVEKLLLGVAESIPIELSSEFVSLELSQLRTLYGVLGEIVPHHLMTETGLLRVDLLKRFLHSQGLTLQAFEAMAECLLKEQLVMRLATGSVFVTAKEIEAELAVFRKRSFQIETLPLRSLEQVLEKEILPDSEVEAFYESQNRLLSRYWSPERRSGRFWTFDLSSFSSEDKQHSPEQYFLLEAEAIAQPGKHKDLLRFIAKYGGRPGSLNKVQKMSSPPDATKSLFAIESLEGFGVSASQGKGYIVQLESISPREQIPLELIRESVMADLKKHKAQEQARLLLSSQGASSMAGYDATVILLPSSQGEIPVRLSSLGLSFSDIKGLFVVGSSLYGEFKGVAYKITLLKGDKVSDKVSDEEAKTLKELRIKEWEKRAEFLNRIFIASLRDNAILLVHTKELENKSNR